jgi:type II secretory pathway component PulM
MADERSDKMVRLLEEIRDLTKAGNEKIDALLQTTRQRYDDALQRQKEVQERLLAQRRRFLWTSTPLLLIAIGFVAYLFFWVIPTSEQAQMERRLEETRRMQSNYLSQPR